MKKPKEEAKAQAAGQQPLTPKPISRNHRMMMTTKALNEAIKKLYDRPTEGLKTTYLADGTVMVELPEEFMEVSVIKINPDGSKSLESSPG